MTERRVATLRRDLNDLVRDSEGNLSPTKIGLLIGQWLAVKLVLEHGEKIIANWDSLMVLFSILIAPEMFKKLLNAKFSAGQNGTTVSVQKTESVVATQTVKGKK